MTRRIFIGDDGGVWKFRISKPGFDAKTVASNSTGLLFDAAWETSLPIHQVLTVNTPSTPVSSFSVSWSPLPFVPLVHILVSGNIAESLLVAGISSSIEFSTSGTSAGFATYVNITASSATFYAPSPQTINAGQSRLLIVYYVPGV